MEAILEADVVVVGAGPAGSAFALNLAPLWRVLLLERRPTSSSRIGESLAPAARRLLTDMQLWDAFLTQGHTPCHGVRSAWGAEYPSETDRLRDLDGPAWNLDRARFDDWLRTVAVARGAALLTPAQFAGITSDVPTWQIDLAVNGRHVPIRTRLLVDAGGRGASLARRLGARRRIHDRLVCGWLHGQDATDRQSSLIHIEAEPDGWWYTARLPKNRRVVAFHTDADLQAASSARSANGLLQRAAHRNLVAGILTDGSFSPDGAAGFCAAHSTDLTPVAGDGWLAIGDAALGFDPLSSQGLFNALYTGLAGAEAADRYLKGEMSAFEDYQATQVSIRNAYRQHLRAWYGLERRWATRPFWERRLPSQGQPAPGG